mgnify:CR=1 FL=1
MTDYVLMFFWIFLIVLVIRFAIKDLWERK